MVPCTTWPGTGRELAAAIFPQLLGAPDHDSVELDSSAQPVSGRTPPRSPVAGRGPNGSDGFRSRWMTGEGDEKADVKVDR